MAQLSPEAADKLKEGIELLLGKWDVFQFAIQNQPQRAQQLPVDIYQWLTKPSEALFVQELEDLLGRFWVSLKPTINDASVLQVADYLMVMHKECLEGNFSSIGNQSIQVVNGGKDDTNPDSTPSLGDELKVNLRLTKGGPTNDGCRQMALREFRKRG